MIEYKGVVNKFHSLTLDEDVSILKYTRNDNLYFCECSRCGKLIKRVMYVVQNDDTDVEMLYLGSECIKKLI